MPDTTPADSVLADTVPAGDSGSAQGGAAAATARLVTITDSGPMIVATVMLPGCEPGRALAAFTDPVVLARWWRGELAADLVPGGQYSVSFPAIPARMAGQVVSYVPGRSLEITWAWDDKERPATTVTVRVQWLAGDQSTELTIEHGPHYEDEGGRIAHAEHWEGWEYFLPRLPAAVAG
ncbi:MAG TPA: SRPBCC domain-containing protein [Streptosporangiaceae bacterium]|jgi:uncharacterized protein YndB with AHSA1/START domain|nr:SRPBCC domain-containing protein [Streptosporangiaceae bacterium]